MHHVGLYMAKERGAKIANQVLIGVEEDIETSRKKHI